MWLRKKSTDWSAWHAFSPLFLSVQPSTMLSGSFFYFVVKRCFWQRNAVPQSSIVPPSTLNGGSTSLNRRTSILNRPAKCHTEKSAQWIYRQQTVGQGAPLGEKQVNLFLFAAMRVTVKSFFTTGRASTKHFLRRIFLRQNVSHRNYTKLKCWGSQYGFFFLDFCQNSESGSRGSTPCLVYHNSGRKVLVAFLGRLFFCWLARAQFVSITDTVP